MERKGDRRSGSGRRISLSSIRRASSASISSVRDLFRRKSSNVELFCSNSSKSSKLPVSEVRALVLEQVQAQSSDQFDSRDLSRLVSDDWFIERFIRDRPGASSR